MLQNRGIPLIFASSSASGKTRTLNARITPYRGLFSLTTDASITSLLDTSPTSANLIGISFLFKFSAIASREPRASVFKITPSTSVKMRSRSTSSETSLKRSSIFSFDSATYNGAPANASSRFGAAIFTPTAAETSFTEENLSLGSLISSKGLGRSKARTVVTMGPFLPPNTIMSSLRRIPSYIIAFTVVPKPTSSLTSKIVPLAGPLVT